MKCTRLELLLQIVVNKILILNRKHKMKIEVERFAGRMQSKLNQNTHKGGWRECTYSYLLFRLEEEVAELRKELIDGNSTDAIANECADIGNFAMMIFDKATTLY